jgi:hypothetical protein
MTNNGPLFLRKKEVCLRYGIPESSLKHMVSARYKYQKPPHKKIGRTSFYGPIDQLDAWWNSDLSGIKVENNSANSAIKATKLKLAK